MINGIIDKLILEKIEFSYRTEIPPDALRNMTIERRVDFETRNLQTFFRTFILGRKVREEVKENVIVYNSWWDHFKSSHFPKFLTRRFPPRFKYEPITINHYHLCPHTGLDFRGHNAIEHFRFLKGSEENEGVAGEIQEVGIQDQAD
jgi:hypothetical protein